MHLLSPDVACVVARDGSTLIFALTSPSALSLEWVLADEGRNEPPMTLVVLKVSRD